MDLAKLKAELDLGHPTTGAYDTNDAAAMGQINAENRTKLNILSMTELREWAAVDARAFNLRQAIGNEGLSNQVRNLAILGDILLGTDDGALDPGNAIHVTMVNELVAAGVWSAADKTALIAKATEDVSRAVELGLGKVGEGHIAQARA